MPGKPWRHEHRNIPGLWNHVLFSTEIRERSRNGFWILQHGLHGWDERVPG